MTKNANDIIEGYDNLSIPDLEEKLDEVEPDNEELDILLQYEQNNKDRKGAAKLLEDGVQYDDWGETYGDEITKGRFRRDEVISLLQKAIRRSQKKEATWAAWELFRSGYTRRFWRRMRIASLEDLAGGQDVQLKLYRLEMMSKHQYGHSGWLGRLCAINAAITACEARSSRECTYSNGWYERAAEERALADQEDREPEVEIPVTEDELHGYGKYDVAVDKHTMWGRRMGRVGDDGWVHFRITGERVGPEGETDLAENARRQILNVGEDGVRPTEFSDEEIEHTLKPTDEDGSWEEDSLTKQTHLSQFREE